MRLIDADSVVNELKREKFIESETVLSDIHQGYNAGLNRAWECVSVYLLVIGIQTEQKSEKLYLITYIF